MSQLIDDPYFRVFLCPDSSSPDPEAAIWKAQHVCVAEQDAYHDAVPANPGQAVINHQLKVKHYSVLEFAHATLHFQGFPHDTVMQLVRHQDSKPLVQSMRYTGERMVKLARSEDMRNTINARTLEDTEMLFYAQPVGDYASRNGRYSITEYQRTKYLYKCFDSAIDYADAIADGQPEEAARRLLRSGYRQDFCMSGSVRAIMHWLDQRTLMDTQIEARTLAWMALEVLKEWSPNLFRWYEENRAGKNLLAP